MIAGAHSNPPSHHLILDLPFRLWIVWILSCTPSPCTPSLPSNLSAALHLLADFLKSGELARHNAFVNRELGKKCKLLCAKLRDVGITDFYEPKGGYFVWAQSKGKMTGKGGEACTINKDK